ncbi:MAG: aldo/keto reductase [Candidatus Omnitrophica bacterium]|nr:aldo/keto reductase [Candidatus Omnitrophota bacterium]
METRELGNTGIKVSAISLGGVAFTWLDRESSEKLIDFSVEYGINYIDIYAGTQEKIKGALKRNRDKIIISTRGNSKTIDQYLEFFNLDYFDIFLLSMIDSNDQLEKAIEDAEILERSKRSKFRFLGIATHNPSLYEKIIKIKKFQVLMFPLNCIDEIDSKIFSLTKENHSGIIAMKPMAGGNIRKYDSAIKYVLNKPVSTALIGMASINEVEQNISVLKDIKIRENDILFYNEIKRKLGKVFCRYCGHCIFPEPCPEGIPVRTIMMLETLAYQANLRRTVSESVLKSVEKCKKCGRCEQRCPYNLPIRKLLPEKVKYYLDITK